MQRNSILARHLLIQLHRSQGARSATFRPLLGVLLQVPVLTSFSVAIPWSNVVIISVSQGPFPWFQCMTAFMVLLQVLSGQHVAPGILHRQDHLLRRHLPQLRRRLPRPHLLQGKRPCVAICCDNLSLAEPISHKGPCGFFRIKNFSRTISGTVFSKSNHDYLCFSHPAVDLDK